MDQLFYVLSAIHPLSEDFKNALAAKIVPLSLPRNYPLLDAGNIAEHAYFLNDGLAMSFRYRKGKKQVEEFYTTGRIIISPKSFFEQFPSFESIELLVQSEVLSIRYESVMSLLKKYAEADTIFRVTMNLYYESSRERIRDFQVLTAEERYNKLHQAHPLLEQLVPQEYIASYLGIAPQSLSRIKRRAPGT